MNEETPGKEVKVRFAKELLCDNSGKTTMALMQRFFHRGYLPHKKHFLG
jgi:hypothetical protein